MESYVFDRSIKIVPTKLLLPSSFCHNCNAPFENHIVHCLRILQYYLKADYKYSWGSNKQRILNNRVGWKFPGYLIRLINGWGMENR